MVRLERHYGLGFGSLREPQEFFSTLLVNDSPGVVDYRAELLGILLFNRANVLKDKGRFDEAETLCRKAVELSGRWATEFPNVVQLRVLQAHSHNGLGHTLWQSRRPQEGEKECAKALELFEKLATDFPATAEHQIHVANCHLQQAGFFAQDNRPRMAEEAYRKAVEGYEKLATAFPDVREYRHELGRSHNWLGILLAGTGRLQEAEQEHRQAVALYEKLIREVDHLTAHWHRRELAWTNANLGIVLNMSRRPKDAEQAFRHGIALLEKLDTDFPNQGYTGWLPNAYNRLAHLLSATGQSQEAEKLYQKVLELKPDSAQAMNTLAWLLATCPDAKFRNARRAVELAKKAIELEPKQGMFWNTLGVACYRARDWKATVEALEKSVELQKGGDANDWFFLAMAHWQLNQKDEAHKWYDRAVAWMDKNQQALKKNPHNWDELGRFRVEAAELLEIKKK